MGKYIVYKLNEDGSKEKVFEYDSLAEAENYEDAQAEGPHSIEFQNEFGSEIIS